MSQSFESMRISGPMSLMESRPAAGAMVGPQGAPIYQLAGDDVKLQLAALLETSGVTDAVAMQYGADDVFDLAQRLLEKKQITRPASWTQFKLTRDRLVKPLNATRTQIAARPKVEAQRSERLLPLLLRGPMNAVMLVIMLAITTLYEMAARMLGASSISTVAGMSIGMVVAGGLFQAVAWRTSMARSQGNHRAVRSILVQSLSSNLMIIVAFGLVLAGLGLAVGLDTASQISLVGSMAGLSILLIVIGSFSIIEKTWVSYIGVAAALAIGAGLYLAFPSINPLFWIGPAYLSALATLGGLLTLVLHRRVKRAKISYGYHSPSLGQVLYRSTPYVVYGALTVLCVISIQASSLLGTLPSGQTIEDVFPSLRVAHLLGMSGMILTQGLTEYALRDFWKVLEAAQSVSLDDRASITRLIWGFLRRHTLSLVGAQLLASLGVGAIAYVLWSRFDLASIAGPLDMKLFATTLVGYGLLSLGFFGCSFLTILNQPATATKAIGTVIVVQLVAGAVFGQIGGPAATAFGLVLGGLCLTLLSFAAFSSIFDQVEYAIYQAF